MDNLVKDCDSSKTISKRNDYCKHITIERDMQIETLDQRQSEREKFND